MLSLRDLVLSLVQGITEFLPVSSSAHLVLVSHWLGFESPGLLETMVWHMGSLVAVLVLMRKQVIALFYPRLDLMLVWFVAVTTVVTVAVAFPLHDLIEEGFRNTRRVALELIVTGLILVFAHVIGKRPRKTEVTMSTWRAAVIGFFQGIAAIPGISRSGTTLAASLSMNLNRKLAVEYSFIVAIPVIGGAFLYEVLKARHNLGNAGTVLTPSLITGFVVSLVSSYVSLKWLLRFLISRSLLPFALYCVLIGAITWIHAHFTGAPA